MYFFTWLSQIRELPRYILSRCMLLSIAMLLSALVVLAAAGSNRPDTYLMWEYADYTSSMAVVVFFTGLFSALFLEDILNRRD